MSRPAAPPVSEEVDEDEDAAALGYAQLGALSDEESEEAGEEEVCVDGDEVEEQGGAVGGEAVCEGDSFPAGNVAASLSAGNEPDAPRVAADAAPNPPASSNEDTKSERAPSSSSHPEWTADFGAVGIDSLAEESAEGSNPVLSAAIADPLPKERVEVRA